VSSPYSAYMEWAKTRSSARFNLASSGLDDYPLSELGAGPDVLEIGDSYYGYPPLLERLARKAGADPDRIVHATGTSMANLLVLGAVAESGDEVLIEEPTYTLLADASRWLKHDVRRFPRRAEAGFRIDPRDVERALTPRTRLVVITNPRAPSRRPRTCAGSATPRARWAPGCSWTRSTSRRTRCSGGRRARRRGSATSS
jgi:Aminotransferase class I and II